jgi:preprotein translocase subunit SecD
MCNVKTVVVALFAAALFVGAAVAAEPSRLQFRIVVDEGDSAASEELPHGGEKLRVLKDVVLDERGIESAARQADGRNYSVSLKMTAEGAERLKEATSKNIGRRLAVVFDGKVLTAPMIRSMIGESAVITGGSNGFSREEAEAVVKAVGQSKSAAGNGDPGAK